MKNGNRRPAACSQNPADFSRRLTNDLDSHWSIIQALADLRQLPAREFPDIAIAALLGLPAIRRLRSSWELWDVLVIGEGFEPDSLLLRYMNPVVLDVARDALWGAFDARVA